MLLIPYTCVSFVSNTDHAVQMACLTYYKPNLRNEKETKLKFLSPLIAKVVSAYHKRKTSYIPPPAIYESSQAICSY
ncbi:hypothetical protein C2H97_03475 [Bacillus subtilis PY79]|nr:hypothetical protein C2H97_03475 [Bacillus subtilis PY79]